MGADETGPAGPVPYAGIATLCVTFHGATFRSAEVYRVEETYDCRPAANRRIKLPKRG